MNLEEKRRIVAPMPAALGFSDHAGWAVMAAVERGASGTFELLFRRRIETCPLDLPRQAYHAVGEQGAPRSLIAEVRQAAVERSSAAIAETLGEFPNVRAAAVGMGRTAIPGDMDRVLASHALLHAAEGEMYRDALCDAAAGHGLGVVRFLSREVRSEAAAAVGLLLPELEEVLATMGKAAGKPWTKDEKDASAAAILALGTVH